MQKNAALQAEELNRDLSIQTVFVKPNHELPLLASIDVIERWNRQIKKIETGVRIEPKFVARADVSRVLSVRSQSQLVVFAHWLVDDISLETPLETDLAGLADHQVRFYENKSGLAPFLLVGKGALELLTAWEGWNGDLTQVELKAYLQSQAGIEVSTTAIKNSFWGEITDKRSVRKVEYAFLKHLQFRPGGLVAKYLNRPISIQMTRSILRFPWMTANVVTIIDFFIGLAGLALFLIPSWEYAVLGAILFQLNSIVDGVDGEIARIRHHSSLFGANLDSFADETLAALSYPAFGYHVMIMGGSPYFLYIGIVTAVISYTYAMINFHTRYVNQSGVGFYYWWDLDRPMKKVRREADLIFYIKHLFWRESIIFFLIFITIFEVLQYFLIFALIPALVTAVLLFIHIVIKRAKW